MTPPKIWTPDELALIWYSARKIRGFVEETPAALWWPALLTLVWETKQMPFELLGRLTWQDLPLDRLHPSATESLLKIRRETKGIILDWPGHPNYLTDRYARGILRPVGLATGKIFAFRRLVLCSRKYPRYFHPADLPVPTSLPGGKHVA